MHTYNIVFYLLDQTSIAAQTIQTVYTFLYFTLVNLKMVDQKYSYPVHLCILDIMNVLTYFCLCQSVLRLPTLLKI
jgi:hypothetical protein